MLKKTLILALVLILLVGIMVFPASAVEREVDILDYNDFITDVTVDGDNDLVTIYIPKEYLSIRVTDGSKTINSSYHSEKNYIVEADLNAGVGYNIIFYLGYYCRLLLDNIPDETIIHFDLHAETSGSYDTPSPYYFVDYYGYDDGGYLLSKGQYVDIDGTGRYPIVADRLPIEYDLPLSNVWNAESCVIGLSFRGLKPLTDQHFVFTFDGMSMTMSISSLYRLQQETKRTNEILDRVEEELKSQGKTLDSVLEQQEQTNEKLDSLPGEIGDEMQGVIDSEKQEASNAGDSAAGELMDIIPNESQGFMDAIQSLVSSMSYNGTEAKLPVPAIKIPAIAGVMDEIKLTDELSVDFGYWVQQMPSGALKLVQILCTIALIVYCFKELYSMIAYSMTLRGGGSSE